MRMFEPLDLALFAERTDLRPSDVSWSGVDRLVSLRHLKCITDIRLMNDEYLAKLLGSVTLVSDEERRPYAGCKIKRIRADPAMLGVGQTFVEAGKLLALQSGFFDIFHGSGATAGFAKKGAMIVVGVTDGGDRAMAHYLPPIVEWHGGRHILLDGIHRGYTAMRVGTTVEIIKICAPVERFPAEHNRWCNVELVDEKPPKEKRFFNLEPRLFRDLKYVGIDG